jgi:hypothetical protein
LALVPADYPFTATDAGKHTFSVTYRTAGTQYLNATDVANVHLTGAETGIVVS